MHFSLETFISVAILLTFIVYIYQPLSWQSENYIDNVYSCIKKLDVSGKIRENALLGKSDKIKKDILLCTIGIDVDVKINSNCINRESIAYYIYGNDNLVSPKVINLCIKKL